MVENYAGELFDFPCSPLFRRLELYELGRFDEIQYTVDPEVTVKVITPEDVRVSWSKEQERKYRSLQAEIKHVHKEIDTLRIKKNNDYQY